MNKHDRLSLAWASHSVLSFAMRASLLVLCAIVLAGVLSDASAANLVLDARCDAQALPPKVQLNGDLCLLLDGSELIDPAQYSVLLDGKEVKTLPARADIAKHAVIFTLARNEQNKETWAQIFGSPTSLTKIVAFSALRTVPADAGKAPTPQLVYVGSPAQPKSEIHISIDRSRTIAAAIGAAIVLFAVWGTARNSALLRDPAASLLPASLRPYSLGRWQMAFWFTLVLVSWGFLWALVGDYNTVTSDAVTLMGISAATGLGAVAVDVMKKEDSPWVALQGELMRLNVNDSSEIDAALARTKGRSESASGSQQPAELTEAEKKDREIIAAIKPYIAQSLWHDLLTDGSGASLHRLQVFCWTLALGTVFLLGVYQNLGMPTFNSTLLALMAVSGSAYVGFKYPEKQQS